VSLLETKPKTNLCGFSCAFSVGNHQEVTNMLSIQFCWRDAFSGIFLETYEFSAVVSDSNMLSENS